MYTQATKWEKVGINGQPRPDAGHVPVLFRETLQWLKCRSGGVYLDCTLGYGGHGAGILSASAPDGILIGIDKDHQAVAAARASLGPAAARARLVQGDYRQLKGHLRQLGIAAVDGVLFDLGASSAQFGDPSRGFSFMQDGPLDMRMDQAQDVTAAKLLNELPEQQLADLIFRYGEERYSRRIARAIVTSRARQALKTTQQLVNVVRGAVPATYRHGRIHCATRTFQALRIAVNQELEGLGQAIRDAAEVLKPLGRLCIISFHSLEDRVAKQTIRSLAQGESPLLRSLIKKPLIPSESEVRGNPRARSAKLRVAERMSQGGHV
jgi:16S rRNA (cytosine1402-N4)-methyltransferase